MKKSLLVLICTFIPFTFYAQNLIGAWENESVSQNGEKLKNTMVFANNYQVFTTFNATTGEFIQTKGGEWKLDGNTLIQTTEFDTENAEKVGTEERIAVVITNDKLEFVDKEIKMKRVDHGKPGKLHGAWVMSGRERDGEMQIRDTTSPRKTMKILSGTRFQWIAYNTETKEFMGTGGGTYTTLNGEYIENIEFFSKDISKVGLSLKFNFEIKNGNWIHKGFSSKGDPIHEVWSERK